MGEIVSHIDVERGLVTHVARGVISFDDVLAVAEKMTRAPEFEHSMGILWDARQADLREITLDAARALRDEAKRLWDPNVRARTAVVVRSDFEYAVLRQVQSYLDALPREVGLFRALDEAQAWLERSR